MGLFSTSKRKMAVAATGLIVAVGIGGTAYAATTSSTSPAPASTSSHSGAGPSAKPKALLARADHATVELKVKGAWVTYDIDRGKVTAVSSTSISIARPDGQSVTEAINGTTKFDGVTAASSVEVGKAAVAVSSDGVATRIAQKAPKATSAPAA